jgi:hypothetical protein
MCWQDNPKQAPHLGLSSGVNCEPYCNVTLCAQRTELIHIFVFDGETAIIMPKLLGTTTQTFSARVTRCQ